MARSKQNNKKQKKRFYKRKGLWVFLLLCVIAGVVSLFVADNMLDKYREQAAQYDLRKINELEVPSRIFDRDGAEIGAVFVQNRRLIAWEDIPQTMVDALVAGEDSRFWEHDGVDYVGIGRAFYLNWKAGQQTQGASTITQQLARNAFPIKEDAKELGQQGYERKLTEVFVARRIEEEFSKEEILTMYLNRIAFGSGFFGLRAASMGYFGKEPKELTTVECATLVGCIKGPRKYSPLRNPENSRGSRDNVLLRMSVEGFITAEEKDELQKEPLELNPQPFVRNTSHLNARVISEALAVLGEKELSGRGYRVYTTIDARLQALAERRLRERAAEIEKAPGYAHATLANYNANSSKSPDFLQGAGLVVNHNTGEILSYVGGRSFKDSQFDFIELGRRPIGTAIFPIVYASAFSNGMSPVTQVLDEPMDQRVVMVGGTEGVLSEWGNESQQPRYEGRITARRAFAAGKISATVRLGRELGLDKVMQTGRELGLDLPTEDIFPRELLGQSPASVGEMTRAYATIARRGVAPAEPQMLARIEDVDGNVLYEREQGEAGEQVLDAETSYQVYSSMRSSGRDGSARGVAELMKVDDYAGAVQTGTTQNFSDNWIAGFEGDVTCVMWMGFVDGARGGIMRPAFSRDTILPVWAELMQAAPNARRGSVARVPDGLEAVNICSVSGLQTTRFCYAEQIDEATGNVQFVSTGFTEYLRKGEEPVGYCDVHGDEGGGLSDLLADFSPDAAPPAEQQLLAIPIRPQGPALVGEDPYGARMPSLAVVEEPRFGQPPRAAVIVDTRPPGSDNAELIIHPPGRLEIIVD